MLIPALLRIPEFGNSNCHGLKAVVNFFSLLPGFSPLKRLFKQYFIKNLVNTIERIIFELIFW